MLNFLCIFQIFFSFLKTEAEHQPILAFPRFDSPDSTLIQSQGNSKSFISDKIEKLNRLKSHIKRNDENINNQEEFLDYYNYDILETQLLSKENASFEVDYYDILPINSTEYNPDNSTLNSTEALEGRMGPGIGLNGRNYFAQIPIQIIEPMYSHYDEPTSSYAGNKNQDSGMYQNYEYPNRQQFNYGKEPNYFEDKFHPMRHGKSRFSYNNPYPNHNINPHKNSYSSPRKMHHRQYSPPIKHKHRPRKPPRLFHRPSRLQQLVSKLNPVKVFAKIKHKSPKHHRPSFNYRSPSAPTLYRQPPPIKEKAVKHRIPPYVNRRPAVNFYEAEYDTSDYKPDLPSYVYHEVASPEIDYDGEWSPYGNSNEGYEIEYDRSINRVKDKFQNSRPSNFEYEPERRPNIHAVRDKAHEFYQLTEQPIAINPLEIKNEYDQPLSIDYIDHSTMVENDKYDHSYIPDDYSYKPEIDEYTSQQNSNTGYTNSDSQTTDLRTGNKEYSKNSNKHKTNDKRSSYYPKFKKDFPLRDDLYIGEDGGLYLKPELIDGNKFVSSAEATYIYENDDTSHEDDDRLYELEFYGKSPSTNTRSEINKFDRLPQVNKRQTEDTKPKLRLHRTKQNSELNGWTKSLIDTRDESEYEDDTMLETYSYDDDASHGRKNIEMNLYKDMFEEYYKNSELNKQNNERHFSSATRILRTVNKEPYIDGILESDFIVDKD